MPSLKQKIFNASAGYTADGRKPFGQLVAAFNALKQDGWIEETVAVSARTRDGALLSLPILSYRTQAKGPAAWIIGGIHGEEPAGPNAIAESIDHLKKLGRDRPVVLLPVCNPLGYATNWRYLNLPKWAAGAEAHSVGDSEHVLPALDKLLVSRLSAPLSPESAALVDHVLKQSRDYPPALSVDLHEDDLIDAGYVYSQGGPEDPVAQTIVNLIAAAGIKIQWDGQTRFGEPIVHGIVGRTNDGSIDELLSSDVIVLGGRPAPGPGAKTAIVVETPASALPLAQRKAAHLEILKNMPRLAGMCPR